MARSLLKSTSAVSSMTLISRILGFVRDALVAQLYGATAAVDAFYVAFKIPNFMRNLFAEGCFSQAFVPVLAEYRTTHTKEETENFISHISASLGLFLLFLTILGVTFAPYIVMAFAPGYWPGSERHLLATQMLRITTPYLLLISLTALASSILNRYRHFVAPAFTPALLNICFILAAFFLSPHLNIPVEAQAWAVLIAGFVQSGFLMIMLWRYRLLVRPRLSFKDPGVNKVLKLMIPALFGASIGQLSLLINTIFASFLAVGSISWLYYSERLVFFPLGVFGVALATVVLPHLSSKHAAHSLQEYTKAVNWGTRCNLIIGLPAMVCLMVLSAPFIISLFAYGHFTAHDVWMTQKSVLAYSFGLPAFMLVKVLSSAFYARQDTKTPVKLGVISIIANMILNAALVWPFAHMGLALAAALGSWINVILLLWHLKKQHIYALDKTWWRFAFQMMIANSLLAVVLWWLAGNPATWLSHHWLWRLEHVLELGIIGIVVYFGTLWCCGMRWQEYRIHDE